MTDLAEGLEVTPTIKLVRPLGAGGMGSVWLAHHARLNAEVVVKFLAMRLVADEVSRARFSREAAAAAQVRSPHVVQILDHGVTDAGMPFIVMERLEGRDLAQLLRERTLEPTELAHVVEHISLALERAHSKGIVHRDIKPANIFLCEMGGHDPFVKLLDFGIAKGTGEDLTTTGQLLGTPAFMAPELLHREDADARSDIWSLGVVAFRALTGKTLFTGESVGQLMAAILNAPITMPSALRPELPVELDVWFARACQRDPQQRFQSAREMAEGLWLALGVSKPPTSRAGFGVVRSSPEAATEAMTTGTLRSTVGSRSVAPPKRRRGLLWGALSAVVTLGLLSIWFVSTQLGDAPPPSLNKGAVAAARSVSLSAVRLRKAELAPPPGSGSAATEMPKPAPKARPSRPRRPIAAPPKQPPDDDLGF